MDTLTFYGHIREMKNVDYGMIVSLWIEDMRNKHGDIFQRGDCLWTSESDVWRLKTVSEQNEVQ